MANSSWDLIQQAVQPSDAAILEACCLSSSTTLAIAQAALDCARNGGIVEIQATIHSLQAEIEELNDYRGKK